MSYGDSFLKRTGKSLSNLAFETTKQSRILRRRMRIGALQKEVKADLRDLGSLAFDAISGMRPALLEDEETRLLIARITKNKHEIERLREAIDRISRARKHHQTSADPRRLAEHFPSPDDEAAESPAPPPPAEAAAKPKKKGLGFLRKKAKKTEAEPSAEAPPAKPEKKRGLRKLLSKKK